MKQCQVDMVNSDRDLNLGNISILILLLSKDLNSFFGRNLLRAVT
jgi:hypothetical protein